MTLTTDDRQAFDAQVLAQVERIRRVGIHLLRRRDELDDFTQETLVRVYLHRDRLREPDCLPQWVEAIARNTARKWNGKWQFSELDR